MPSMSSPRATAIAHRAARPTLSFELAGSASTTAVPAVAGRVLVSNLPGGESSAPLATVEVGPVSEVELRSPLGRKPPPPEPAVVGLVPPPEAVVVGGAGVVVAGGAVVVVSFGVVVVVGGAVVGGVVVVVGGSVVLGVVVAVVVVVHSPRQPWPPPPSAWATVDPTMSAATKVSTVSPSNARERTDRRARIARCVPVPAETYARCQSFQTGSYPAARRAVATSAGERSSLMANWGSASLGPE
jgi:hypothetical protein